MEDQGLLKEKINKALSERLLNNFYDQGASEKAGKITGHDGSFIFSYDDHGIKRLIFFTSSIKELDGLLGLLDEGPYYLDIMTRDPESIDLKNAKIHARMMRLSNPDCNGVFENGDMMRYCNDQLGQEASVSDTKEINRLLWSTFDTAVSHLLSDEELEDKIRQGDVLIHRGETVDAVLQTEEMPKKFYINQVVNKADRSIIHAMMLRRLDAYRKAGGKYIYSWVEERNTASLKFHSKYGMKHDGMWDLVYLVR